MIDNMAHGGRIALLGIMPAEPTAIDWNKVIFNMLTDPRHLRARDVRDLVQDDGDDASAASTSRPVITHRFRYKDFEEGFAAMIGGADGQGDPGLDEDLR